MTTSMNLKFLMPGVAVSAAMTPRLLGVLKAVGFSAVIDVTQTIELETEDKIRADIAARARKSGIEFLKFADGTLSGRHIDRGSELVQVLDEAPKPVVIYSTTGRRAATLWAMAMRDEMESEAIAAAAARAGFEVSHVVATMHEGKVAGLPIAA